MKHGLKVLAATAVALAMMAPLAAAADPLADGVAAFKAQDYPTALRLLQPLADAGDASAEFHLGLMRRFGLGVGQDANAGFALNRKAAEQGYRQARQLMAAPCMTEDAPDPDSDCPQALTWLRADAESGIAEDQAVLGAMYMLGRGGVPRDPAQALVWYHRAADLGDAQAENQLGLIYATGLMGVPPDPTQSLAWYRKAANQGDAAGQNALGQAYEAGLHGAPRDPAQALAWYLKAANQGDMMGQMSAAAMYEKGDGVAADPEQAFFWYRKLAEQGYWDAAAKVGTAYALGKGAEKDDQQAYVWLSLAVAQAPASRASELDATAIARDSIAQRLTPGQMAAARIEIGAWKAKLGAG